jgi:LysR family transcriptional activator of nhaA
MFAPVHDFKRTVKEDQTVPRLNYHHLQYFWAIAHERSLTRAAARLHVTPSALSIQLKALEERLGQRLFERQRGRLVLTEAGRLALEYADTIFRAGEELVDVLKGTRRRPLSVLRVGSVATLSRNFQLALLRPLIGQPDVELVVHSGSLRELLAQLSAHTLDLVLSNDPVPRDAATQWHSHLLAEQPVSLVGRPPRERRRVRFPDVLRDTPVLLPGPSSAIRAAFDRQVEAAGIRPSIVAEVDDMAMLRLLARESPGLALVPPVVVRDELKSGLLVERCRISTICESFYAISPQRRFPNPIVRELLARRLR